ncbi:hypothetical protein SLEP1_g14935 [Rubroshorea leprosula]|uniref:F-box domain-containing protein n=1 Tax=Rubroshorea leprosula TaxID=152421 RepID=A0AAV5IUS5_9ROSI|nr:hypothetical protein SLEP1_g14935 [Rubroshorea leprosula]
MSASPRRQQIDTETRDCRALPADCLAAIISLTSPLDACRWSVVSPFFNSVVSSDAVWVKFLPSDYQNLVPASRSTSSLKDLYLSLCDHPVLIEDGKKSFSLHKRSGKKCYMLAARDFAVIWGDNPHYWSWNSIQDSSVRWFEINGSISTCKLSSMTHYKAYLVFKLAARFFGFTNERVEATVRLSGTEGLQRSVFLHAEVEDVQNDYRYPSVERGDGWLELELGEYFNEGGEDGQLEIRILHFDGGWKSGVIIEGIEIRPN